MQAMGVEVYVRAPQNWDEQGKGQVNDNDEARDQRRSRIENYTSGDNGQQENRPHGRPSLEK